MSLSSDGRDGLQVFLLCAGEVGKERHYGFRLIYMNRFPTIVFIQVKSVDVYLFIIIN